MSLRFKLLQQKYRGFELGYYEGPRGILMGRRCSLLHKWTEMHMYCDDVSDGIRFATEAIDYNYRVEATEAWLGRKLEIKELRPDL